MKTPTLTRRIAGKIDRIEDVRTFTKVPALHLLLDIYIGLMGDTRNPVPGYDQFRPESLDEDIRNVAVFGFGNEGPVFQFVGEKILTRFKESPVGTAYKNFISEDRIESAIGSFTACRDNKCGMFVRLCKFDGQGNIVNLDVLGLPFRGGGESVEHLLFLDCEREPSGLSDQDRNGLKSSFLVSRHFIDLGFGVPSNHTDLVGSPPL